MEYFKERNNLMYEKTKIDENHLKKYWIEIYDYFHKINAFEVAEKGLTLNGNILPPKFVPSPEQYILNHLGNKNIWPIDKNSVQLCDENDIFTLIELYYDAIDFIEWGPNEVGEWGWIEKRELINQTKKNYCDSVNHVLERYNDGYYLIETSGIITSTPNYALKKLFFDINEDVKFGSVYDRLISATKNYYRFDSNLEVKRMAIVSLANILEPIRQDLIKKFNEEYGINKKQFDKSIFEIVNNFDIRHNTSNQMRDYSKAIWYDWMMQYYTSIIIAYYKLLNENI